MGLLAAFPGVIEILILTLSVDASLVHIYLYYISRQENI